MERKPPQDSDSRHADKYIVRFPDGMRDRLKEQAKASNRTLNAEIIARLQQTFDGTFRPNAVSKTTYEEATPEELAAMRLPAIRVGGGDFPATFTEQDVAKIATQAAERAIRQVLRPEGVDLVSTGAPTIVQGNPPGPEIDAASVKKISPQK